VLGREGGGRSAQLRRTKFIGVEEERWTLGSKPLISTPAASIVRSSNGLVPELGGRVWLGWVHRSSVLGGVTPLTAKTTASRKHSRGEDLALGRTGSMKKGRKVKTPRNNTNGGGGGKQNSLGHS